MGKKTLNNFFESGNYFLRTVVLTGVLTVPFFYCILIYARLTICAEDLLLLHPLIARLSTETAAFVLFGVFVASVFVSGCIQTFTSASCRCRFHRRQPLRHSLSPVCHSLSPVAAFHSLTSASPAIDCHSVVYFAFLLPLSAS